MRMEYEKMLDRLYLILPKQSLAKERFELPLIESFIQGPKTQIKNFSAILKIIRRDEKHLFKYIGKEFGTAAFVEEGRLILNGKFSQIQTQKLFDDYIKQFILCPECKKPDTHVEERQGVRMLKCEACGAISSVKGL